MTYEKLIYFLLFVFFSQIIFAQSHINYTGQYTQYGLYQIKGIRHSISYEYSLGSVVSLEGVLFTGSGKGKNINDQFQKNFLLFTIDNEENIDGEFGSSFPAEGIVNIKSISSSLFSQKGFGLNFNFSLLNYKNWKLGLTTGYMVSDNYAIINDIVLTKDINPSFATNEIFEDVHITLPIHIGYVDGTAEASFHASYQLGQYYSLGSIFTFAHSFWTPYQDTRIGVIFKYKL